MRVKDIGEDGLIAILKPFLHPDVGDDCAVIPEDGEYLIITTDMLIEGTHFVIPPFTWYGVGTKAVLSSISDIVATGGIPLHITVSLGLKAETPIKSVEELYRGMSEEARRYGCQIVGGDTCRSRQTVISIAVIGKTRKPIRRSGARPGDLVAVTGYPGSSAIGLEAILKGYPEEIFSRFIERHIKPALRIKFALKVAETDLVSSMMDISDGLVIDAERLASSSGVSIEIDISRIPHPQLEPEHTRFLKQDLLFYTLHGGEEYELLLTFSPAHAEKIKAVAEETDTPVAIIGSVKEGRGVYLLDKEKRVKATHRGFSHF